MIIAGEASGDDHAAAVVREMKKLSPGATFFGMGGGALRREGVETVVDSEVVASVMGLTEVFSALPRLITAFKLLLREAKLRKPDVVVLIDLPDFNLRMAAKLKKLGIKVVYFISPQLWAWRKGRIRQVKRNIDKVIPIFPFEESFYHQQGVNAEYLGHPFIDTPLPDLERAGYLSSLGLSPFRPLIALLPGSRKAEISRLLPPMLEAFSKLALGRSGLQAVIPAAPTVDPEMLKELVKDYPNVKIVKGDAREIMSVAQAAIVASGTATLEAALVGVPFVVIYKLSPFTYAVGKMLIRGVKFIAMPNLIAARAVVEELIQEEASSERITEAVERLLGDEPRRVEMKRGLTEVKNKLYFGFDLKKTVSSRVARAVLELAGEGGTKSKKLGG
jgi:lipid-A-disaccharide synthase